MIIHKIENKIFPTVYKETIEIVQESSSIRHMGKRPTYGLSVVRQLPVVVLNVRLAPHQHRLEHNVGNRDIKISDAV